ncbi:MAG: dynamin family protein [Prochloraceae cyanobacterium]|nr:dynamin family protein [Prochloraceae cyanobacterium]
MNNQIFNIDKDLQIYRLNLDKLLVQIFELAEKVNNQKLIETLNSLKKNLNKPFMFVVVGEVKSGKSSFVNALISADVCQTDLKPCTDKIQEIYYSPEELEREINLDQIEIGKPIEILKEICIVDTPGTNSIINNHQILTEKFIPNSDLIFFVLLSKALFCQSTWDFLNFINLEWHTKIVFIIQQSDLLTPEQLNQAISEVKEIAVTKGIDQPYLFATSALLELNEQGNNSGFKKVRKFIKEIVKTRQTYKLKLHNATLTTKIIIKEIARELKTSKESFQLKKAGVELVKRRFESGRNQAREQVKNTINHLSQRYSEIGTTIKQKLRNELTLFSLIQKTFSFSLNKYLKSFTENCQKNFQSEINQIAGQKAKYILDGILQFSEDLNQELETIPLNNLKNQQNSAKNSADFEEMQQQIKSKVDNLIKNDDLFKSLINAGATGEILAKTGLYSSLTLIVIKIIELGFQELVALVVELALGGLGIGFFLTGFNWQRNSIINRFNHSIDETKNLLSNQLEQRLNQELSIIYDHLEEVFFQFYDDIAQEEKEIRFLEHSYSSIKIDFEKLDFNQLSLEKS